MKFTFKTTAPTGPYRSFDASIHDIKLGKKIVGTISDNEPYKISLMVLKKDLTEDKNLNCFWRWVHFRKEFNSLQEAKDFLNSRIKDILAKYDLYQQGD